MDLITLAAAKGYVGETADSLGAVKGAPATIKSITEIDGGHRVTFEWTGTSGTKQTSTLDVMNGVDGIGITSATKTKTEGLVDTYTITFTDGSTFNYEVTNGKNGKDGSGSSTGEENVIESIKVNGVAQTVAEDKSVDITVPTVDVDKNYVDTELTKKANSTDVIKEISDKIAEVISDAPESFDTLKEISDWISGHENDASAMNSAIKDNKSAIMTLQTDKANKVELPTELPANGGNADTVNGHTVKSDVPENAVFTDTIYDYSALLGYDIYNLVSLKDARYQANKTWLSKDFIAPFDGFVFFMVQTDGASGAFSQVFKEDDVLISDNQKNIADFNTWGCAYYMGISKGKTYHFGSYTNTATAFNKVMLCIRKKFEPITEYVPYAPSNVALAEETVGLDKKISDNSFGEIAGGKNLANFSRLGTKTTNGITFEYQSNGSIKVSGTVSKDDNVYTPLKLTKTRLSKGCWYTASVKSSNPKSIAKLFFTDNGTATMLQMSETADIYYYLQFYDNANGKIPAGTVIDEVLYPQIEEGKVVTEYEPYFPSNQMLMEEKVDKSETTVNLLNPTSQTATQKGITCTNNGDGTYTISGTSTAQATFQLAVNVKVPTSCILTGCKGGSPTTYMFGVFDGTNYFEVYDVDNAKEIPAKTYKYVYIVVRSGVTIPGNTIITPMITTNLNATYSDFVPYTGSTGNLNGDVADLRGDVDGLKNETKATINDTSTTSTTETWSAKKINEKTAQNFDKRIILSVGRGTSGEYTDTANLNSAYGAYLYWASTAGQEQYSVGVILYVNKGWMIIPIKETDGGTNITFSINGSILTMTKSSSNFPSAGGVIALGSSI